MFLWAYIMTKRRLSAKGVARTLLHTFEDHKPLSASEAERVSYALESVSNDVPDALERLVASYARLLLKQVTE